MTIAKFKIAHENLLRGIILENYTSSLTKFSFKIGVEGCFLGFGLAFMLIYVYIHLSTNINRYMFLCIFKLYSHPQCGKANLILRQVRNDPHRRFNRSTFPISGLFWGTLSGKGSKTTSTLVLIFISFNFVKLPLILLHPS